MAMLDEHDRLEYAALMKRAQDAERVALGSWVAGVLTAAVTMSWAISAKSAGLMIPVVLAVAAGFYGMLRGRGQVRAIASYIEEFCEGQSRARWFSRIHRVQRLPGYHPAGDWLTACVTNAVVVLALVFAWLYAEGTSHGELMAGIVTTCGILFGFHSVSETIRMTQTDWGAMWRQVEGEQSRTSRAA